MMKNFLLLFSLMSTLSIADKIPTIPEEIKSPKFIVIFASLTDKEKPGIQSIETAMETSDWKSNEKSVNIHKREYPEKAFWAKVDLAIIKSVDSKGKTQFNFEKLALECRKQYLDKEKIDISQYSGVFIINDLVDEKGPLEMQYASVKLANKEPTSVYFIHFARFVSP